MRKADGAGLILIYEAGGKPGVFTVSDICDGVVQATNGMSYSLISRDIMAAMVEIHALGHPHDGMVLISGNDKSVPVHLVAIARCNLPAIHLPGGTQYWKPTNPLFGLDNVVITPHAAYYSEEAMHMVRKKPRHDLGNTDVQYRLQKKSF